jgi:site-specific DNA-methyltransferase (adenine-specific)
MSFVLYKKLGMVSQALFSSNTEEWYTPQDFFKKCDEEVWGFDLDPCATAENAKCSNFFTKEDNWLVQQWEGKVWVNPPYWRAIYDWVAKCSRERERVEAIYLLIPSRTDTRYFHEFLYNQPGVELRFIRWRLKFGWATNSAPFPSLLAIFTNN